MLTLTIEVRNMISLARELLSSSVGNIHEDICQNTRNHWWHMWNKAGPADCFLWEKCANHLTRGGHSLSWQQRTSCHSSPTGCAHGHSRHQRLQTPVLTMQVTLCLAGCQQKVHLPKHQSARQADDTPSCIWILLVSWSEKQTMASIDLAHQSGQVDQAWYAYVHKRYLCDRHVLEIHRD